MEWMEEVSHQQLVVDVGAVLQQGVHHLAVAVLGGHRERRAAALNTEVIKRVRQVWETMTTPCHLVEPFSLTLSQNQFK